MEAANRGAREAGRCRSAATSSFPTSRSSTPMWMSASGSGTSSPQGDVRPLRERIRHMPGGYGTLDELFESLTLIQTSTIRHFPLILLGATSGGLISWMRSRALADERIDATDLDVLRVVDDPARSARSWTPPAPASASTGAASAAAPRRRRRAELRPGATAHNDLDERIEGSASSRRQVPYEVYINGCRRHPARTSTCAKARCCSNGSSARTRSAAGAGCWAPGRRDIPAERLGRRALRGGGRLAACGRGLEIEPA